MLYEYLMPSILAAVGILVKIFPNLIAGYNTMPPEKKAKFNIKAFSTLMMSAFLIMAAVILGSRFYFQSVNILFDITIILVGVVIMLVGGQIYNKSD